MPRLPKARRGYGKLGRALSWHIVTLYFDHDLSAPEIANQLNHGTRKKLLCSKTVSRLIKRFESTSDVRTPKEGLRSRGMVKITKEQWDYIIKCYLTYPSFYLQEIQDLVFTNFEIRIPISTLVANLNRQGWTLRVSQQRAISRNLEDERNWITMANTFDPRLFMFTDFTHQNPRKQNRRRGRGVKGTRTQTLREFTWGRRINSMAVLSLTGRRNSPRSCLGGIIYSNISYASANADRALIIVEEIVNQMNPYNGWNFNSVLCMDNASYYQDVRIRAAVEAKGARLFYIPPGAKENNPIEEAFSKLVSFIERERMLSETRPIWAIHKGLSSVTHHDAEGYFRHAGWMVQRSLDVEVLLALGYK